MSIVLLIKVLLIKEKGFKAEAEEHLIKSENCVVI